MFRLKEREHIIIDDELVLIKPKDWQPSPVDCSVCGSALRDQKDIISYKKWECCTDCQDLFAYPNKDKWVEGWRPSVEEIKKKIGWNNL